jgi:hypothetical protein
MLFTSVPTGDGVYTNGRAVNLKAPLSVYGLTNIIKVKSFKNVETKIEVTKCTPLEPSYGIPPDANKTCSVS